MIKEDENSIEDLAEYAHEAWSGWMRSMFGKVQFLREGNVIIPKHLVDRWLRQSQTPYKDLPEEEKDSDRHEATEMLKIINKQ